MANGLLFISLLGLLVIAYSIAFDKKVPVPDIVVETLTKTLDSYGVKTKFSSIAMGFDFTIVADDVSLKFKGTPEDFFVAKKINVGLSLLNLIVDNNIVEYVEVVGGAAGSSYEGVAKKPILKDINVLFDIGHSNYNLRHLHFYFHNLAVRFSGKIEDGFSVADLTKIVDILSKHFAKHPSKSEPKKDLKIADIVRTYDDILLACTSVDSYLNLFVNPSIAVDFGLLESGSNFFKINCSATSADFKDVKIPVAVSNLKFALNYANTSTTGRVNALLSVDNAVSAEYPLKVENIFARTGIHIDEKDIALFDARMHIGNSEFDGTKIGGVRLAKDMISMSSYKTDWHWLLLNGNRRFSGVFALTENSATTTFAGDVDIDPIFKRKELSDIPEMKDFSFPNGIHLSGKATYNFAEKFPRLKASIDVSNAIIMRLDVDSLMADVSFSDGVLVCSNIVAVSKEGWGATGRYEQNFINNAYDITVKGNLRPMAIAHFMEPWWTKVMGSFTFGNPKQLPIADVRVEGVWGAPENIWCYGYVAGHNALYNGAKFDDFSLFVWVNPTRISLYDIFIKAQERTAMCFIEWLYTKGEGLTSYDYQRLNLDSKLNSTELIALGGDDAKEVLDIVHFSVAPELKLIAHMFNPDNNPQKKRDIFNAEVFAPKETSIEMIKINNASCTVRSDQIDTDVENAHFYFCDGKADGNLHLRRSGDTMIVSGKANAEKMNQGEFFKFLESLGSSEEKSEALSEESALGGSEKGEVSATIKLSGDVKNMINSKGEGTLLIESKDFLKLNVFGAMSKAFNSIGLPIGAFDINTLKTSFEIGSKELKVSPIEITGPSMRVIGASIYSLESGAVRGEMKAYPFAKVENTIVSAMNKLVNPLMDTVRITISGTLGEPEFSAKVSPVDVIRSEKNVIDRIDKSL